MAVITDGMLFAGRYRLITKLGAGGFSEVWKAEDTKAGNMIVAIKIFAPGKGITNDGVQMFSREYSKTFNLRHRYILSANYFDVYEQSPYLVMPFCKEGSLYTQIARGHVFSETEIATLIQQIGSALHFIHSEGLLHQDIKPENIFVYEKDRYMLGDFGISSKIRRTMAMTMLHAEQEMRNKFVALTPVFAPPEANNALPTDKWDIFSFGVALYEAANYGELPYSKMGEAIKNDSPIPDLPAQYSEELSAIIKACLVKAPNERLSAKELFEFADIFIKKRYWPIEIDYEGADGGNTYESTHSSFKDTSHNYKDTNKTRNFQDYNNDQRGNKKKRNNKTKLVFFIVPAVFLFIVSLVWYINTLNKQDNKRFVVDIIGTEQNIDTTALDEKDAFDQQPSILQDTVVDKDVAKPEDKESYYPYGSVNRQSTFPDRQEPKDRQQQPFSDNRNGYGQGDYYNQNYNNRQHTVSSKPAGFNTSPQKRQGVSATTFKKEESSERTGNNINNGQQTEEGETIGPEEAGDITVTKSDKMKYLNNNFNLLIGEQASSVNKNKLSREIKRAFVSKREKCIAIINPNINQRIALYSPNEYVDLLKKNNLMKSVFIRSMDEENGKISYLEIQEYKKE